MTNIQAIDLLKGLEQSLDDYCELNDEGKTAFHMAITALEVFGNSEQLPSAQPEQLERCPIYDGVCGYPSGQCYDCPRHHGAQPEPHEGHWIPHESPDGGEQYECSECGVLWEFNDGTPEDNEAYYCPKCGTKMKGERQK